MNSNPAVVIRRGLPADASALAAFAIRSFRATYATYNSVDDMELYVAGAYGELRQGRELRDLDVTTLLAEVGTELVGFAQLRSGAPPVAVSPHPLEISRFYVDGAWHGRGIAPQLMNAVLDAARERGADMLWLGVWERNPRARAFYRKSGFVDAGTQTFVLGTDLQVDRVMVRPLTNRTGEQ